MRSSIFSRDLEAKATYGGSQLDLAAVISLLQPKYFSWRESFWEKGVSTTIKEYVDKKVVPESWPYGIEDVSGLVVLLKSLNINVYFYQHNCGMRQKLLDELQAIAKQQSPVLDVTP